MEFSKVRQTLFFGLLGLTTIILLYILNPFAYALFWAAILAAIFYPFYKWLNKKLKAPNLSATLTLIVIFVVIVLPLTIMATLVIKESVEIYEQIDNNRSQINQGIQGTIDWAKNSKYLSNIDFNEQVFVDRFSEITKTVTNFIFSSLTKLTQNSLRFLVMFLAMLYTLFFFIRDGERFLKLIMYLCPLGDKYEKMLYDKFTSTSKATIKGTIIIAGLQGLLGGIMFTVVGIEGAIIWGIIMFVLSIIPVTGSGIIWAPAGIILIATGQLWQGILVLAFGVLVISLIDNILRPILVGKDTQMHPLLVLFSTLGGIVVFGISGFIIGPIVASLFLAFWHMYGEYYKKELKRN